MEVLDNLAGRIGLALIGAGVVLLTIVRGRVVGLLAFIEAGALISTICGVLILTGAAFLVILDHVDRRYHYRQHPSQIDRVLRACRDRDVRLAYPNDCRDAQLVAAERRESHQTNAVSSRAREIWRRAGLPEPG